MKNNLCSDYEELLNWISEHVGKQNSPVSAVKWPKTSFMASYFLLICSLIAVEQEDPMWFKLLVSVNSGDLKIKEKKKKKNTLKQMKKNPPFLC